MTSKTLEKPIFFSIRKNSSYFSWMPYNEFFAFKRVCIEALGDDAFIVYDGNCHIVQVLGRKCLVSAARYRKLRNGIYLLEEIRGGKYVFRLVRPLRRNA